MLCIEAKALKVRAHERDIHLRPVEKYLELELRDVEVCMAEAVLRRGSRSRKTKGSYLAGDAVFDKSRHGGAVYGDEVPLEAFWVLHVGFVGVCSVSAKMKNGRGRSVSIYPQKQSKNRKHALVFPESEMAHAQSAGCPVVIVCESSWVEDLDYSRKTVWSHEDKVG